MAHRSLHDLRRQLKEYHPRSSGSAVGYLTLLLMLYGAAFAATLRLDSPLWRLTLALAAGVFSGSLFMIGHDACHGSFTNRRRLNRVLGRVAFLSTYHTYSLWELSHNRIHHVYTNLKGKDFVWTPLSKPAFDALAWPVRWWYRACRTVLGLAMYYPFDIWLPRLVWPRARHLDRPRRVYALDRALVLAFLALQVGVIAAVGHGGWGSLADVAFALVVPWWVFNWMIGFVIYFNHTHPTVAWFDKASEWSLAAAAVQGTVRLKFPRWSLVIASNIMDHVAHHVDPRIPLPRLKAAQERIEALLPGQVVVQAWSVRELRAILTRCKLYDYDQHCWLDFAGRPTTGRLVARPDIAPSADRSRDAAAVSDHIATDRSRAVG